MRGFETLHVLSHLTVANLEQVPFAARFVSGLAGTLYTFPKATEPCAHLLIAICFDVLLPHSFTGAV